jgi:hypothetical protein
MMDTFVMLKKTEFEIVKFLESYSTDSWVLFPCWDRIEMKVYFSRLVVRTPASYSGDVDFEYLRGDQVSSQTPSWFPSVIPDKCHDVPFEQATTAPLHILSAFILPPYSSKMHNYTVTSIQHPESK